MLRSTVRLHTHGRAPVRRRGGRRVTSNGSGPGGDTAQQPPSSLGAATSASEAPPRPPAPARLQQHGADRTGLLLIPCLFPGTEGTRLAWGHLCPPVQRADKADGRKMGCCDPGLSPSITSLISHRPRNPVCRPSRCSTVAADRLGGISWRREWGRNHTPTRGESPGEAALPSPTPAWFLPALHPSQSRAIKPFSQLIPTDAGCALLQILFPDRGIAYREALALGGCVGPQRAGPWDGGFGGGDRRTVAMERLPPGLHRHQEIYLFFFLLGFHCWRAALSRHSLPVPGTCGAPCAVASTNRARRENNIHGGEGRGARRDRRGAEGAGRGWRRDRVIPRWWLPGSSQARTVRFQHNLLQLLLGQRATGLGSSIHLEKVGAGWGNPAHGQWSPQGQGSTQSIAQRGQQPCALEAPLG